MLYREIVTEARRLPLHERLRLVEELLRDIRLSERPAPQSRRRRVPPFSKMRGALKPAADLPSDSDLRDLYDEHLMDKYL
jgi:hypothetical protein